MALDRLILRNGRWVPAGASAAPEPSTTSRKARVTGVRSRSEGNTNPTPTTWPDPPDYPVRTFESLYVPGDTFVQTMKRMTTMGTIIETPPGEFEIDGAGIDANQYLMFLPNARGIRGRDPANPTVMKIKPNSVPSRPGPNGSSTRMSTAIRIMNGRDQGQTVNENWQLLGSDQPVQDHFSIYSTATGTWSHRSGTHPADQAGFVNYLGRNAYFRNCDVSGFQGSWNSPDDFSQGETFEWNHYKDIGTRMYGCSSSGFNAAGKRTGGCPCGMNGTIDAEFWDCDWHDAYVSGFTASFAGSSTNPTAATISYKCYRNKFHRNANQTSTPDPAYTYGSGGKGFTSVNGENLGGAEAGTVLLDHCDWSRATGEAQWGFTAISLANKLADNPNITILGPTWTPWGNAANGAYQLGIPDSYDGVPNKQVSVPRVQLLNGTWARPCFATAGRSSIIISPYTGLPIDKTKEFVVWGSDRRP